MFTPVLGRAGSGKTTFLLELAGKLGQAGEKVIFLVPEQFSFETERRVYRRYGAKTALNIEVLSFTRLCNKVFNACGGIAGEYVDDTARRLLMALAVNELKDKLNACAVFAKNPAAVEPLLQLVDEFKQAGITPEQVMAEGESGTVDGLGEKLTELGELYGTYQAMLEQNYLDSADDEARCIRLLEGRGFFAGYTVIVDSFMTFMAGEYGLLRQIFASAKEVYISFVCSSLKDEGEGMGVFDVPVQTALRLIRDAKSVGCSVATPICLTENHSFASPVLAYIEKNYPLACPQPCTVDTEGVRLLRAADPYEEIRCTAAGISRLVREQGLRYGEIAVIGRSMERFEGAIREIFPRYDIPYFMDEREDVSAIPVIACVTSALDTVCRGFEASALLALAKSTLLGLTAEEIGKLENYCYIWGVKGAAFRKPFTANPRGLSESFTDEDKLLLEEINRTRAAVVAPLVRLRDSLREADGEAFARAVYAFLEDIHAREHLTEWLERREETALRYVRLNSAGWSLLMKTLGVFAKVVGKSTLPSAQLAELLKNALYSQKIGSIPHTQDQVLVGMADRVRPVNPKAVFVIGVNDGVFPAPAVQGGLLTEQERRALIARGIQLSPPASEKSLYEAYYAYFALTAPSHYLTVSWHGGLLNGEPQKPSEMARRLAKLLGLTWQTPAMLPQEYFVGGGVSLLEEACCRLREDTALSASLTAAANRTEHAPKMRWVLEGLRRKELSLKNPELTKELFGQKMRLSPSRIEDYHKCPFQFFCYSGLKLKPRRRVEFSPLESGNVIHYVLEKLLGERTVEEFTALSEEELRFRAGELLRQYLAEQLDSGEDVSARFHYLFARLENAVVRLLRHLADELAQSRFVPCAFEFELTNCTDVSPLVVQCADGTQVEIIGKIDRVDMMENGDDRYIRVIDYKSGRKKFRLDDVYHGLNLQMLVYLFSLWKNGKNRFANTLPAGILYMPSGDKIITAARGISADELEKERNKHYKMSGLLLEDLIAVRGMEAQGKGVYVPASINKDGSLSSKSSVVNLAQMGLLSRYIQTLTIRMADSIYAGQIAPLPVSGKDYDPCSYCDYKAVCGREQGDSVKELKPMEKAEMFRLLREDEGKEGEQP